MGALSWTATEINKSGYHCSNATADVITIKTEIFKKKNQNQPGIAPVHDIRLFST